MPRINKVRYIKYEEPIHNEYGEYVGDATIEIKATEAIRRQKKIKQYPNDRWALDDFIVNYWAEEVWKIAWN